MDPLNPSISYPHLVPPYTLLGGPENVKLLYDTIMSLMTQGVADNQANARAYNALNLRAAENAAVASHFVNMNVVIAAQTGGTSGQQTTSPIRTGVGDTLAASAYPANRAVDVGAAGISTANEAIAAAIAKSVNDTITTELSTLQQTIQALADAQATIAAALTKLATGPTPPTSGGAA